MWLQQNEMQNYIHDDSYIEMLSVDEYNGAGNIMVEEVDEHDEMQMIRTEHKSKFNSFLFGKANPEDNERID